MKNWKEQLRDAKRTLFGVASKVRVRPGEKPDNPKASTPNRPEEDVLHAKPKPSGRTSIRSDVGPGGSVKGRSDGKKPVGPSAADAPLENRPVSSNGTATPPAFRPRIDSGRSLVMPDWSGSGKLLQHPDYQGGRAAPMVVRIGVDFGTAFTKVAIRAGVDLVPVDWSAVTGDASSIGRYVMPGFVHRGPDGEYCWRRLTESEIQGNLKLSVIEMAGSDECPTATLAYLALIIRYARAFLYRHPEVGRKLVARSLRWELNVGCPTKPHERPEVVELFRRLAWTAWRLAGVDDLLESNIAAAWRSDEANVGLETEPGVVPEFVAQIAGYLGSPQVSEGLHALIDIGAATLDVATFNVVLPNDLDSSPRIPIFFPAVRLFGTHYLYHNRHSKLDLDFVWDDAAPVEPADSFAKRHGKGRNEVDTVDTEFEKRVAKSIDSVINGTRTNSRGDPGSPAWREGLPIFVTGGGSVCDLYRRALEKVQIELKRRVGSSSRFRFIELDPLGAKLPHFGIEVGGRLAVAIGLTEDAERFARVVPHRDIEPITRTVKERVDHTDIYGDR